MNNILRIICVIALGVPVLSRGKKNINLALETSVLFEPQDIDKHMALINDARRFLDTLENAIMPKKVLRDDRPKRPLTEFITRLADTILQLYEEDLETFFKVLENEMKSQFVKGSIFRDIVYDPTLQTFFRNKLKEWANTDPRQMKAKLRQYMARDANGNDTLHELGRFLNDYYGREQEFKMDEIIKRLRRTLDESEIAIIVRDALNTLVLQHYDKMNYTTRAKLVEKINTIKHEYFTSHVDHDLMLTFRRKRMKPQESNYLDNMDAWLVELEKKGAADADIDSSEVDVQVPAEDKDVPVLTLDDWDNWLNKRNMKGIRKVNTLMSNGIEEMIKDRGNSKLKNKHKYKDKPMKVRKRNNGNYESDEPEKVKTTTDFQLGITVIDESIYEPEKYNARVDIRRSNEIDESTGEFRDEPERVKTTLDSKLGSYENDESTDKPEEIKTTADSKSRSYENDKSVHEHKKLKISDLKFRTYDFDVSEDEPEKVKTTTDSKSRSYENDNTIHEHKKLKISDLKSRKNHFDLSEDELEKVKTTADSKSGSNENDESTDESKNFKSTAYSKLGRKENGMNIDTLEKLKTTADSTLGKSKIEVYLKEPKKVKTKDFKLKHKHGHKKRKRKPMKFNADFILGNDHNKVSIGKLENFKMKNNRGELTEDDTETTTRNKGLTTVDVFSHLYGMKPNKELIIDKDLEIFVGGFDASLVGKVEKNRL